MSNRPSTPSERETSSVVISASGYFRANMSTASSSPLLREGRISIVSSISASLVSSMRERTAAMSCLVVRERAMYYLGGLGHLVWGLTFCFALFQLGH